MRNDLDRRLKALEGYAPGGEQLSVIIHHFHDAGPDGKAVGEAALVLKYPGNRRYERADGESAVAFLERARAPSQ